MHSCPNCGENANNRNGLVKRSEKLSALRLINKMKKYEGRQYEKEKKWVY